MGTRMKGLLKGLRYISQIFDEEEEKKNEIQIGYPTDVKHVAHIGYDGPSVDSASWMKEFNPPPGLVGDTKENPQQNLVSQECRGSEGETTHDLQKPSRRRQSSGEKSDSPKNESSSSASATSASASRRHSRKHMSKEPGEQSIKSSRKPVDSAGQLLESPSSSLPDIPKKSRRKKSKENLNGIISSKPSRSKDTASSGSIKPRNDEQLSQYSSMKNPTQEEGVGSI